MKKEIPIVSIERILKRVGAERISRKGKRLLRDYIEEYTEKISEKVIRVTKHAKRKTVRVEDINIVMDN